MSTHSVNMPALGLALCLVAGAALADGPGLGKPLNEADIAAWDISIQPDGKGLPPGGGTPAQGGRIFAEKCATCHGPEGKGGVAGFLLTQHAPTLTLEVGGEPVTFVSVHLVASQQFPRRRTLAHRQATNVAAWAADHGDVNVVVGGDFNTAAAANRATLSERRTGGVAAATGGAR